MCAALSEITHALHARKSGAGWIARCPAHQDKSPSLSIREQDGRVLVHCFSGCSQADVIDALRHQGLWPERSEPGERRAPVDPDRRDDLRRARYWRIAVVDLAEESLTSLPSTHNERSNLTRLAALRTAGDDELLHQYRDWWGRDPRFTALMVWAGKRLAVRDEDRLSAWIEGEMLGEQ
jgi:hypothetical protein